ncbi:MAG: ATP-dependent Clp protease proteolytic subunit [Acidimicrobiales bacterium]|nr:ATP-dependent Clp protease proteolytic subunit [Acidimicrobiales bacterium]
MTYIPNPEIWEQTNRGERSSSLFGKLLREHIVFLGFPISDDVANVVCAEMIFLESENPDKDINLYINSPGGDINAMFAIYDTMSYIKADINTICLGQAASAAAVLLAAGTPGKRLALPHSRIIIHQPYSGAQGQASDVELAAKEILRLKSSLEDVLAFHTGQSVEKIQADTDRDFVMDANAAKEYGLIDEVLTSRADVDNTGAIRAASA